MKKIHFLYEIKNKKFQKSYIGVRSSNFIDLGIKYFSSSTDKDFMEEQKLYPYRFDYIVLLLCDTREEALSYEVYLHNHFNVSNNDNFYNKSNQTSVGFDTTGIIRSEEVKDKIRQTQLKIFEDQSKREKSRIVANNWWLENEEKKQEYSERLKNKISNNAKKVILLKKSTNEEIIFNSIKECSEYLEVCVTTMKSYVYHGFPKKESVNQFGSNKKVLDYEFVMINGEDYTNNIFKPPKERGQKIVLYQKSTDKIITFSSLNKCIKFLKVSKNSFYKYIKKGFPEKLKDYEIVKLEKNNSP